VSFTVLLFTAFLLVAVAVGPPTAKAAPEGGAEGRQTPEPAQGSLRVAGFPSMDATASVVDEQRLIKLAEQLESLPENDVLLLSVVGAPTLSTDIRYETIVRLGSGRLIGRLAVQADEASVKGNAAPVLLSLASWRVADRSTVHTARTSLDDLDFCGVPAWPGLLQIFARATSTNRIQTVDATDAPISSVSRTNFDLQRS
jgi:hypothetical protein